MKPLHVVLFGLIAVLSTSGCASVRVRTDLIPEADPNLASSAGKFHIAGLNYSCGEGNVQQASHATDVAYGKKLLRLLRKECPARYPLLFSKDAESTIPLFVSVEDEYIQKWWKIPAWMYGTLFITPLIIPAPVIDIERDITVSAGLWNGTDSKGSRTVRAEFHRKQVAWTSMLTPLGLISVPGKSDFPKKSQAFYMGRNVVDDSSQVAQQTATALAKIIADKDPEFWMTPPRPLQQPGYFPAAPDGAPSTMPLPTENVAPF